MGISLVGIDHQTALITLREKVTIIPRKLYETLPLLRSNTSCGVILSTCNRTEIYILDKDYRRAEQISLDFLKERLDIPHSRLRKCVYTLKDREAVEHLFRVTSGLESMIVGEFEVLGQVGHALEVAEEAGMVNLPLRHIFQSAIRTGRRVRKETGISRNALSVSSVAVDLASGVVGRLKNCQVLVIGAGEAGRLVAKAAKGRGVSEMSFAGRTKERALSLVKELGGKPVGPGNLKEALSKSDIVVTCAGAPHRILSIGQVKQAIEKRPEIPMVIIDIATPRNVDPAVARLKTSSFTISTT